MTQVQKYQRITGIVIGLVGFWVSWPWPLNYSELSTRLYAGIALLVVGWLQLGRSAKPRPVEGASSCIDCLGTGYKNCLACDGTGVVKQGGKVG